MLQRVGDGLGHGELGAAGREAGQRARERPVGRQGLPRQSSQRRRLAVVGDGIQAMAGVAGLRLRLVAAPDPASDGLEASHRQGAAAAAAAAVGGVQGGLDAGAVGLVDLAGLELVVHDDEQDAVPVPVKAQLAEPLLGTGAGEDGAALDLVAPALAVAAARRVVAEIRVVGEVQLEQPRRVVTRDLGAHGQRLAGRTAVLGGETACLVHQPVHRVDAHATASVRALRVSVSQCGSGG